MKKNNIVWSISLIVIGIATFILAGASIVGIASMRINLGSTNC